MSAACYLAIVISCLLIGSCATQDATVKYSLREELPNNTYVGSVALNSKLFNNVSNEKFQRFQFQILKDNNNDASFFRIETNTSLLWTTKFIDREQFEQCLLTCSLEFNVAVFELSELKMLIKIQVEIEDYNDNTPIFLPIKSPIEIPESLSVGSVVLTGVAVDLDKGQNNSVMSYVLLPETNVFNITTTKEKEFEIRLSGNIDRETVSVYQLVILAKDGGKRPLTGTVSITIHVTDVNDNAPVFSEQTYNIKIKEDIEPNTVICKLTAVDKDENNNGKVGYKFNNRVVDKILVIFTINETNGELSTKGYIDYETDKEFNFQVIAYDFGEPSISTTASVVVTVTDVNDNAPIINLNLPPGGILLSELAEIGTFVTHVEIRDLDSDKNGKVMCNILDNFFKLETVGIANNYKVVLNKTLDHETKASHNVTIFCQDAGDLPKQTYASFIVYVEDMNDNSPVFTENMYTVSIYENNVKGASVIRVSATDKDSGTNGQITYSIHSEAGGIFAIDSFTGVITANISLDRETQSQVIFRVMASDKGLPSRITTGTVVVNILDLNDNDPSFKNNSYEFYIFENATVGSEVGRVSATDPDLGLNGTFDYKFPNDPYVLEYFEFHYSGIITTKHILDREVKAFHQFYIKAADLGGRTSSVLVTVYVKDINDNKPDILYPNEYEDTIERPFSLAVGEEVIEIVARDLDFGVNAELHFYIDQTNATDVFILDSITGKLLLNKSLHRVDIGNTFHFVFRVSDSGDPELSSWQDLNIRIIEGEIRAKSEIEVMQSNLWIVVGIVIVTAILSVIMILIIVKIWWCNRRKSNCGSTSDIIVESNEVDPRLIDSSSSASTSSKDSNENEKIKENSLQIKDGFQKGYFSDLNETGYLTNSSTTSIDNHLYIEQVRQFGQDKKLDETNSHNSEEIGTQDSGQGGSDVDINSLSELPILDTTECQKASSFSETGSLHSYNNHLWMNGIHDNKLPSLRNSHHQRHSKESDAVIVPNLLASFSNNPSKSAEKKEISKLHRTQKRVMFSDDLENSHTSERSRSSTLSTFSHSDSSQPSSPNKFHRMLSEDITSSPTRLSRANDWLRRSADNLGRRPNNDKIYNQLPSNQNKFGSGSDFRNYPVGSNIKSYLDKVMERSKSSDTKDKKSTSNTSRSGQLFSFENLASETSSRDMDCSTTTSGTYDLMNSENTLSLASQSFSDHVYDDNFDV